MLQADSEKLRQAWIQAVQASIASAYRETPDNYYIEVRKLKVTEGNTQTCHYIEGLSQHLTPEYDRLVDAGVVR